MGFISYSFEVDPFDISHFHVMLLIMQKNEKFPSSSFLNRLFFTCIGKLSKELITRSDACGRSVPVQPWEWPRICLSCLGGFDTACEDVAHEDVAHEDAAREDMAYEAARSLLSRAGSPWAAGGFCWGST